MNDDYFDRMTSEALTFYQECSREQLYAQVRRTLEEVERNTRHKIIELIDGLTHEINLNKVLK